MVSQRAVVKVESTGVRRPLAGSSQRKTCKCRVEFESKTMQLQPCVQGAYGSPLFVTGPYRDGI